MLYVHAVLKQRVTRSVVLDEGRKLEPLQSLGNLFKTLSGDDEIERKQSVVKSIDEQDIGVTGSLGTGSFRGDLGTEGAGVAKALKLLKGCLFDY